MKFLPTDLQGAWLIEIEPHVDERGFFARTFCEDEFRSRGLQSRFVQSNVSFNHTAGTLRGMHYQVSPHEETKLVRCSRGAIFDVIVDLRNQSATQGQSYGVRLTADNHRMLYVPKGFAHGFQTLLPDTEVCYQMGDVYVPDASRGFRYDDPAVDIRWPLEVACISDRDLQWPSWADKES